MAFDKETFLKNLETMSVTELMDLIEAIEEKFGVSAAAPVAVASTDAPTADEAPSTVDVMLLNPGASKIQVVKAVKDITGLGLKEAKELVDKVPAAIKENIEASEAETIIAKLKEAGAEVEAKPHA